ncbi:uncharacterized protein LOC107625882 isoform X2 [Arachis ipaensis]|uniref:uncharacterized protein LOC107625882 isoform X2 n=1 Tax=Arachis ipaensis TaxID=130454 RepID=UPI000A2B0FA3|nr:uncharacterized protein LOC107625882 isoform X2 [Arachis ipaensis]
MHWEIFHSYPSCLFIGIDDPYEPASSYELALLASYSEDELAAAYHYFRSLVVESRFSTARDNLIATFEKLYLQLLYQFEQLYFYRAPTKSSKTTGLHKRKQISSKTTRMLLYAI